VAGRAAEVPLAPVLAVAVGGGARLVEPHAADLFALSKVCRPHVEAGAQSARVAVLDAVAHVDRRPELMQRRAQRLEHLVAARCPRLRLVRAHAHPRRLSTRASSGASTTSSRPPATAAAPACLVGRHHLAVGLAGKLLATE